MTDIDFRLLRELLLEAYRDVNPEISDRGAHLVRKLAEGLYARGARIAIGTTTPPVSVFIHQSLDPLGHIVWTCRKWNEVLGYRSQEPVGRHISQFLATSSWEFFKDWVWPELVRNGQVAQVPIIVVRSTGEMLSTVYKSEILREPSGAFQRTFGKLKVGIPAALALKGVAS